MKTLLAAVGKVFFLLSSSCIPPTLFTRDIRILLYLPFLFSFKAKEEMSFLKVAAITKYDGDELVLEDITFQQHQFQKIAVAGETGSGKTTLLRIIAGLEQPDAGEVYFQDRKVDGPLEKLVAGHPQIAYLSQYFELPKSLRVEQVLSYVNNLSIEEAAALYEVCNISHLLKRRTTELSGGEKQRVAMARTIVSTPQIMVLDEPFSNLDLINKNILKAVVSHAGDVLGISALMISHDPLDTLSWADDIIILRKGRLVQQGPPQHIYRQPHDEYVAGLFGKYNAFSKASTDFFKNSVATDFAGENLYARAEHVKFTRTSEGHALKSCVTAIRFFGSYYEITAILPDDSKVILHSIDVPVDVGSTIFISVDPEKVWWW